VVGSNNFIFAVKVLKHLFHCRHQFFGGGDDGGDEIWGGFDWFSVGLLMWKDAGKAKFGALGSSAKSTSNGLARTGPNTPIWQVASKIGDQRTQHPTHQTASGLSQLATTCSLWQVSSDPTNASQVTQPFLQHHTTPPDFVTPPQKYL
jgi:hypothetical protein